VAEEAVEVAQRATKALRFGTEEVQPGQALSNLQRMRGELCDLLAAFEMVYDEAGHQFGIDLDAIAAKKAKVEKFLAYSRELGTLTDGVSEVPAGLSKERIAERAHRIAYRFKMMDPEHGCTTYLFNEATLVLFVRALEAARGVAIPLSDQGEQR
jgi:NTP pyrophosphatase (non-canonical NTP hydrolase)